MHRRGNSCGHARKETTPHKLFRGDSMERKRWERGNVLSAVAELFDLPADVVAGLPHMEMIGDRQFYLEHHAGLLSYSDRQIDANTSAGILRIKGECLSLQAMTAEELRIGGRICGIEWVEVSEC